MISDDDGRYGVLIFLYPRRQMNVDTFEGLFVLDLVLCTFYNMNNVLPTEDREAAGVDR